MDTGRLVFIMARLIFVYTGLVWSMSLLELAFLFGLVRLAKKVSDPTNYQR